MFKEKLKDGELCPLLDRKCEERGCKFWIQILGSHPQTGAPVERWNCTFAWQPILMIENSKIARETGAAVESARNEQVHGLSLLRGTIERVARPPQDDLPRLLKDVS